MTIELKLFLYIYYAFLAVWAVLGLAGIYHMLKFGFKNFITPLAVIIFLAGAVLLIYFSFTFIVEISWDTQISIFEAFTRPTTLPF